MSPSPHVVFAGVLLVLVGAAAQPSGVVELQPIPECSESADGEGPLTEVDCSGVDFGTTRLICRQGATINWRLSNSSWAEGSVINDCKFSLDSDLVGMSFESGNISVGSETGTPVTFADCDLSGLSITNSLARIIITGSRSTAMNVDLSGSVFTDTMFLTGIEFGNLNLEDAQFQNVIFDGLNDRSLENGNELDFPRLSLSQLNAESLQLTGGSTRFRWASITGDESRMTNAKANNVVFEFCDMDGTDLTGADFSAGNITDSVWTNVKMEKTILSRVGVKNFRIVGSTLTDVEMSNPFYVDDCGDGRCPSIEVMDSTLVDSFFFNGDLRRAKFINTTFNGCTFDSTEFFDAEGANFTGSTIEQGTTFRTADLRNADFTGVKNIDLAEFEGAFLGGAILPNDNDCESFCESRDCLCTDPVVEEPEEPEDTSRELACFPGSSLVMGMGSNGLVFEKTMNHLEVGDTVLDGTHQTGSEVYFFSHKDAGAARERFVELETEDGRKLTASGGHYVYVNSNELIPTRYVRPGIHSLISADGSRRKVTSVRAVILSEGLFAPHSLSGDLVVNGFKVSSYTEAVPPRFAHMMLLPIRWAFQLGVAPGWSQSLVFGGRSAPARSILQAFSMAASQFMVSGFRR